MTEEIYVYLVALPDGIDEMVAPSGTGFTIYIDEKLDREHQVKAYAHALEHICRNDLDGGGDVQEIELESRTAD